ncbi:hypothetical protein PFICI_15330 [Pestalotiopsis fici W106-1]|uniref:SMODS and SLOG-associating 2TM effector domain-containing protein n=1 Tax=Pestalotiopsis fici (strain W106-1 / CGMCC3.15140) TaxID=1229662 RepID=W3WGA1_PESFW|nr:uncharacterized protein PFICI_15330 [Pestalotiopsis fici W106-1]ETS72938.1 hypothetical protein PFICI_15330 [Pestalotiopsis fici W106-1]
MSAPKKDAKSPLLSPTIKVPNKEVTFSANTSGANSTATKTGPGMASPATKPDQPVVMPPKKVDTNMSWGMPLGLGVRGPNDENLIIFRKAVGINYSKSHADFSTLEEGRKTATGIYKMVIDAQVKKHIQHDFMTALMYFFYLAQIVIGAALTALGPSAPQYTLPITLLGAFNTIIAGVLALIKGSGQPQRLSKDQMGYRKLQDWIEETEALLSVGVIGRDKKEVGMLVEVAFKRYNAAKASEENNRPDMYVNQTIESLGYRRSSESFDNQPAKAVQEPAK